MQNLQLKSKISICVIDIYKNQLNSNILFFLVDLNQGWAQGPSQLKLVLAFLAISSLEKCHFYQDC